jgi:hypothetical protein
MFNLNASTGSDLEILDCQSGASSFVVEASGKHGVKKDVGMYDDGHVSVLEKRGRDDLEHMIDRLSRVPEFYNWNVYSTIEDL